MSSFESPHIPGRAKVLGPYIYSWNMRLDLFCIMKRSISSQIKFATQASGIVSMAQGS